MQLKASKGFTLTEMAVVVAIIALLIGGAMATLSSMTDQRNLDETNRRLVAAMDAVVGFAVVNKRLPCPAVGGSSGTESPSGGVTCTTNFAGFLPAQTLGFTPVDSSGYAVDAWGNRIRYAVSAAVTGTGCTNTPPFTSQANLKANGVSCKPNDIDVICSTVASGVNATCNNTVHVASQNTIAIVIFSTGKNGAIATTFGADESANTDGNAVFVNRPISSSESALGAFDDLMVVMPAGVLYSKLIAAGVLP